MKLAQRIEALTSRPVAIARAHSRAMSVINPRLPPALVQEGTNSLSTADHVVRYREQTNNKVKTFQLVDKSIASGVRRAGVHGKVTT